MNHKITHMQELMESSIGKKISIVSESYSLGKEQELGLSSKHILNESYRKDWVCSRLALKKALAVFAIEEETLTFPHSHASISHSKGHGVAIALDPGEQNLGLGIDIEVDTLPKIESARFFLGQDEFRLFNNELDLLRLWTIKESVFKADKNNKKRGVLDYKLLSEDLSGGEVICLVDNSKYRYFNYLSEGTSLSCAISSKEFYVNHHRK